jgi:hypothetical protein
MFCKIRLTWSEKIPSNETVPPRIVVASRRRAGRITERSSSVEKKKKKKRKYQEPRIGTSRTGEEARPPSSPSPCKAHGTTRRLECPQRCSGRTAIVTGCCGCGVTEVGRAVHTRARQTKMRQSWIRGTQVKRSCRERRPRSITFTS